MHQGNGVGCGGICRHTSTYVDTLPYTCRHTIHTHGHTMHTTHHRHHYIHKQTHHHHHQHYYACAQPPQLSSTCFALSLTASQIHQVEFTHPNTITTLCMRMCVYENGITIAIQAMFKAVYHFTMHHGGIALTRTYIWAGFTGFNGSGEYRV